MSKIIKDLRKSTILSLRIQITKSEIKSSMHKHDNSFYQENTLLLLLDARCFNLQNSKVLGLKVNYKVRLPSKMLYVSYQISLLHMLSSRVIRMMHETHQLLSV